MPLPMNRSATDRSAAIGLAAVVLASGSPLLGAALDDPLPDIGDSGLTLRLELVAGGLAYPAIPTDLMDPDDGSGLLHIAGLGGVVTLVRGDGTTATFLDTTNPNTDIIPSNYGMTAITAHPGFADPMSPGHRRFYTITTELENAAPWDFGLAGSHQDVLTEWLVDANNPEAVEPGSAREVLRIGQPRFDHNMTAIAFANDGTMLLALGDGGNNIAGQTVWSDQARDVSNVFGTVLRIDPLGLNGVPSANGAYTIPLDNPDLGPGSIDEIWAYGLRSPYRMSVDAPTGDVWIGSVGQKEIESVYRVQPGGDHGWNLKEGSFLYDPATQTVCVGPDPVPGLVDPVGEYDHDDGRSVTGGYVYRGLRVPALSGRYVFGDFQGQGLARLFVMDTATGVIGEVSIDDDGEALPFRLYGFGEDASGELYVLGGSPSAGAVYRIISACPSDLNGDGAIDTADLGQLIGAFGSASATPADINNDGTVDTADLGILIAAFGATCD